jgi:hypothetical protein
MAADGVLEVMQESAIHSEEREEVPAIREVPEYACTPYKYPTASTLIEPVAGMLALAIYKDTIEEYVRISPEAERLPLDIEMILPWPIPEGARH